MTPPARAAAAIEILGLWLSGQPAEAALTQWARGNRFAGSGDRAAIRDLVYAVLRCQRSYAALGGALTARGLILGHCRAQGIDPAEYFTGLRYAPEALSEAELAAGRAPEGNEALDLPDWLEPILRADLGDDFEAVMQAQRARAPVFLRMNLTKARAPEIIAALTAEQIEVFPHPLASTALEVTLNARKIAQTNSYQHGLVELQDAASQAMVEDLPLAPGMRVLDYCAGGGGKALAIAAREKVEVIAHDIDPARMRDLPVRAARAGTKIEILTPEALAREGVQPCDLVLVDAPCSGSGTWRRTPEAKWRLTPARLAELQAIQAEVLDQAAKRVRSGGHLAYMTCSLIAAENGAQVDAFLARHPGWSEISRRALTPLQGGDGFFGAILQHG